MTQKEELKEIRKQYDVISLLDRNAMKDVFKKAKQLHDSIENSVYSDLDESDLDILEKIMSFTNIQSL